MDRFNKTPFKMLYVYQRRGYRWLHQFELGAVGHRVDTVVEKNNYQHSEDDSWDPFITVEVWELISNFIPHIMMDAATYPC